MAITKIEFFDDRLSVHYDLQKPYGVADVHDETIDVAYNSVGRLKPVHSERIERPSRIEKVFIPKIEKMIAFLFESHQENSVGPNEENISGPFDCQ